MNNNLVNDSIESGELLKSKLNETEYDLELPPEIEIQNNIEKYQKGDKKKVPPKATSTPPKSIEEITKNRDDELENYLKTAITINKTDLDTAVEIAEESNKQAIDDIINPTPGLVVDNKFNAVSDQIRSNDNETNFTLSNNLQQRLDDILQKVNKSVNFTIERPIDEDLPNNTIDNKNKSIKTEDIYIEDSPFKDIKFFLPPSTDNREHSEVTFENNDLIVFKSPSLKTVNIARNNLKRALENVASDLDLNLKELETGSFAQRNDLKRIGKLQNLIDKIPTATKGYIENKISQNCYISKLIDAQLGEEDFYKFGEDYANLEPIDKDIKQKFKRRSPYNLQKRKFSAIASEKELKELQGIYTLIPADQTKKIEAAKEVFDKIIKQVLKHKKFKINYDEENNITVDE